MSNKKPPEKLGALWCFDALAVKFADRSARKSVMKVNGVSAEALIIIGPVGEMIKPMNTLELHL